MKAILSMLIFVALFAAIVGSRWNSGYGIPHKHVKLPNGKCVAYLGTVVLREMNVANLLTKGNSSGCGRTWSAMAGGFVNECYICNLESSMC
uniref:U20-Hexatoxin-Hc1g_1 n=1 Tax=Hadronyche cerberea TaxID=1107879 RepID=A0A4Q8K1A5_HADCE